MKVQGWGLLRAARFALTDETDVARKTLRALGKKRRRQTKTTWRASKANAVPAALARQSTASRSSRPSRSNSSSASHRHDWHGRARTRSRIAILASHSARYDRCVGSDHANERAPSA